jgi:hypothetical protein
MRAATGCLGRAAIAYSDRAADMQYHIAYDTSYSTNSSMLLRDGVLAARSVRDAIGQEWGEQTHENARDTMGQRYTSKRLLRLRPGRLVGERIDTLPGRR